MNANKVDTGFKIAIKSFYFLWEHKLLLLFSFIPQIINIFLDFLVFNLIVQTTTKNSLLEDLQESIAALSQHNGWYYTATRILFNYFQTLLVAFFFVALIYQTNKLLNEDGYALKESFLEAGKKWLPICLWILIGTGISYALRMAVSMPTQILLSGITLVWYLCTFFVLPLIALTNKSLLTCILTSFKLIKEHLWLVIGGCLFFAILYLILIPFGFLFMISNYLMLVFDSFISVFIQMIIYTIFIIFKAMIYRDIQPENHSFDYLKQPTP